MRMGLGSVGEHLSELASEISRSVAHGLGSGIHHGRESGIGSWVGHECVSGSGLGLECG